jgi:hypothetical protein
MDFITTTLAVTAILGAIIFWKIGAFHRLIESVQYIHANGWTEYRAARNRYDEHMRLESQAQPTKSERRNAKKQQIKRWKQRK